MSDLENQARNQTRKTERENSQTKIFVKRTIHVRLYIGKRFAIISHSSLLKKREPETDDYLWSLLRLVNRYIIATIVIQSTTIIGEENYPRQTLHRKKICHSISLFVPKEDRAWSRWFFMILVVISGSLQNLYQCSLTKLQLSLTNYNFIAYNYALT